MPIGGGKLLLVGLNSNLYYRNDALTANLKDPGDQFVWLNSTLTIAANNGLKVAYFITRILDLTRKFGGRQCGLLAN